MKVTWGAGAAKAHPRLLIHGLSWRVPVAVAGGVRLRAGGGVFTSVARIGESIHEKTNWRSTGRTYSVYRVFREVYMELGPGRGGDTRRICIQDFPLLARKSQAPRVAWLLNSASSILDCTN